mgnify:CR=1 FL=1
MILHALAQVSDDVAEVNAAAKKVELVYIGWSLYNDKSEHAPFAARFASALDPSQAARDAFKLAASGQLGAPHVLLLGLEGGTCSADGVCAAATTTLVCSDAGGRVIRERGASAERASASCLLYKSPSPRDRTRSRMPGCG